MLIKIGYIPKRNKMRCRLEARTAQQARKEFQGREKWLLKLPL